MHFVKKFYSKIKSKTMVLTLCISFAFFGFIVSIPETPCNRIRIDGNWYEREILWAFIGRPSNLIVHRLSNTLFFSYTLPDTYSEVDFQLAMINIDTRESQIIAGIRGGCAVAIDDSNDIVYLGGSSGIYTYNMLTKIADYYKENGKNVWSLFYRKNLFYVSYPDQRLWIEVDGKFSKVKEFEGFEVDNFYIKPNNDIFFANKTGFYNFDDEDMRAIVVNDMVTVRQISEDIDGKMYVTSNVGVYTEGDDHIMRKIINMKNVFGLAFDRDNNVIFSDDMSIVKLVPSETGCLNRDTHW